MECIQKTKPIITTLILHLDKTAHLRIRMSETDADKIPV